MDTLIEIEQAHHTTPLSLLQAMALSVFITFTTLLGVSHGKHMEKTVTHVEIPIIHYAVQHSRRMDSE